MMTIKEINTLIICGALLLIALFGVWLLLADKMKEKSIK